MLKNLRAVGAGAALVIALGYLSPAFAAGGTGAAGGGKAGGNGAGNGGGFLQNQNQLSSQGGGDLSSFGDLLSIRNEFLKEILLERMVDAEVRYKNSLSELNYALADRYRLLNDITRQEYQRVQLEQWDIDRRKLDIALKNNLITPLKMGNAPDYVWIGLDYFFQHIIPVFILKDAMSMEVEELSRDNFFSNDGHSEARNFTGGNMGQMLLHLRLNKLSMRPWSKAHFAVLEMMARLTVAAEEKIAQYNRYMDMMRKGTLPIWGTPTL